MNTEQIKEKLLKMVSSIVNFIANNEYEKLETLIQLHGSWYNESGDTKSAIMGFKNAIEGTYNSWAEDMGKPFKINTFTEKNMDDDPEEIAEELLQNGNSMMTYDLKTVDDDPDYFWLEIYFDLTLDNEITAMVNLNM
ncbi:hypothetical protein LJC61_07505 [Ruminococcaceae bacterium OttesenSCG-928-A16]|nr:hypothetical protein [Ruminococcaceae bacterium OttesenSCG-928-A16]